jgi:hypothetical protein
MPVPVYPNSVLEFKFISNVDTKHHDDGPESWWNIIYLSIEQVNDDYIFHVNTSKTLYGYCYPYFTDVSEFNHFSKKLSDLKDEFTSFLNEEKTKQEYNGFIHVWEETYSRGLSSSDQNLISEMRILDSYMYRIYDKSFTANFV